MGRNRRWLAILGICAIAASACGGASDSSTQVADTNAGSASSAVSTAATSSLSPDERATEVTDILLTTMSDGTAIEALLLAIDAGYSADQIDAGIRAGGLDQDGVITSTSGDTVAPAGPAAGLILDDRATGSSAGIGSSALQFEPVAFKRQDLLPIGELRRHAEEFDGRLGDSGTLVILRLIMAGFDQEAIVGSLVFGGIMGAEERMHEVDGEIRSVTCPYTHTIENPKAVYVSRLCTYFDNAGASVYIPAANLPIEQWIERSGSAETAQSATGGEATESDAAAVAVRTWEGRFVDTSGSVAWTTTRTTLVLVEEQPDGSLTMRRQTDSAHTADLALLASACPYVFFDTGESTSAANRPLDSLRFEGTREGVYEEGGECADEGGPAPGPGKELVTGSLDGDVLTLNSWFDGEGPSVLDPPTTK